MKNTFSIKILMLLLALSLPLKESLTQGTVFYWLEFTDKIGTPYSIDKPQEFLSAKAITRREQQQIPITEQDLPVTPIYIQKLSDLDLKVVNVSKWFNGAIISSSSQAIIDEIESLHFVAHSPRVIKPEQKLKNSQLHNKLDFAESSFSENYGLANVQLEMLNSVPLHSDGFNGQGKLIAILDAGFTNSDSVSSLQHIWNDQRVIAMRDFVKDGKDFFDTHRHGTVIFSILGGIDEGYIYGSAPMANFALVRTEDGASEYIIEEYNWIVGAEFADSLGADVISSSLGYSLFNDPFQSHTYADMDGKTTPVTKAAEIAASKGMFIVSSAGNSGGPPWYKITAPADGENVMTVSALDSAEIIRDFSSRGPSYDQRIKPDVSAMGYKTISQLPSGDYFYCTGTSCSAPLISGMVTCLWQAVPEATSKEIFTAIRKSGSRYFAPDTVYGYGVPDFMSARLILEQIIDSDELDQFKLNAFPNPFNAELYIEIKIAEESLPRKCDIEIYDLYGRLVFQVELDILNEYLIFKTDKLRQLSSGKYTLQLRSNNDIQNFSITKIQSNQ